MKLILSSRDFHEEAPRAVIAAHLPKPAKDCRVLFIPGENATAENLKNDMYNRRMRQKGFSREKIEIFDHTAPKRFFKMPLDVIYIGGGNTFLLLEKLRSTGFGEELCRMVRAGVTYIGGSAGAHVVSMDVRHVARYDALPEGFEDFSGLGLVNAIFVCHFGQERREHFEELQKVSPFPVYALTNDQTVVFENGSVTRFG